MTLPPFNDQRDSKKLLQSLHDLGTASYRAIGAEKGVAT